MMPAFVKARIKATSELFFTDTCTIEATSTTVGVYGQPSTARVVVAANVPCRLLQAPQRDSAEEIGSQETIVEVYPLEVPLGTPLAEGQWITVKGETYLIVKLDVAKTDAVFLSAEITRFRDGE